jgi:hypothetical protein
MPAGYNERQDKRQVPCKACDGTGHSKSGRYFSCRACEGSGFRRLHVCSTCGREGIWDKNWSWHGSFEDIDDGRPLSKYCSPDCVPTHVYTWKNNEKRETLYNRPCRILKRWRNSRLVEFDNGQQEVVSGNALRRIMIMESE